MRESKIEAHLRDETRKRGGRAYKWVSPGNNGVPDRMVLMPGGRIWFVELKAPGKAPTKLQLSQHKRLRELGFQVSVIDSIEGVDALMEEVGQNAL